MNDVVAGSASEAKSSVTCNRHNDADDLLVAKTQRAAGVDLLAAKTLEADAVDLLAAKTLRAASVDLLEAKTRRAAGVDDDRVNVDDDDDDDDRVAINVSGLRFETRRSTLARHPGSSDVASGYRYFSNSLLLLRTSRRAEYAGEHVYLSVCSLSASISPELRMSVDARPSPGHAAGQRRAPSAPLRPRTFGVRVRPRPTHV